MARLRPPEQAASFTSLSREPASARRGHGVLIGAATAMFTFGALLLLAGQIWLGATLLVLCAVICTLRAGGDIDHVLRADAAACADDQRERRGVVER